MTTDRTSQRPSDRNDRYTTNKADITCGTIQNLRPDWTVVVEHQDAISIVLPGLTNEQITIWFGPLNETWGGSVTNVEGHDLGYLETQTGPRQNTSLGAGARSGEHNRSVDRVRQTVWRR